MPFDTPGVVIERFRALGAVRCSISVFPEGWNREYPDKNLVYFWDAQGREIGYWNRVCEADQVFAPNHRVWSAENLAIQKYEELTAAGGDCE